MAYEHYIWMEVRKEDVSVIVPYTLNRIVACNPEVYVTIGYESVYSADYRVAISFKWLLSGVYSIDWAKYENLCLAFPRLCDAEVSVKESTLLL